MAYNKVEADGKTLIDLTSDTVTADTLVSGRTAHLASGAQVTGTFEPVTGVKGNAESTYRKGNVNLTPANIGAATSAQGTKADSAVQTIQINGTAQTKTNGTVNLPAYPTKSSLGLGNVDNTSDANKPISTAAQTAFDNQQAQLDKAIKRDANDDVIEIIRIGNITVTRRLTLSSNGSATLQGLNQVNIGAGTSENPGIIEISATNDSSPQAISIVEDTSGNRIDIGKDGINLLVGNNALILNSNGLKYNGITLPIANNASFHNNHFRGKDLTNVYTIDEMYDMIHSGKFDDLFLGDYFTKSMTTDIYTRFTGDSFASGTVYYEMGGTLTDRTWTETEDTAPQTGKVYCTKWTVSEYIALMYAAFDYYYNVGDTALTTHHAALIPRGYGFATPAKMNSSNTTVGSYYNCDMHQIVLPCYAKSLKTALNNHLLAHRTLLPNAINASAPTMAGAGMTGASNNWAWGTVELQLMNEPQIYGTTIWSSSAYDVGVDYKKLPVFDFINNIQYGRDSFWLRSVVSSTNFANCGNRGNANSYGASNALFVRPLILFG